MIQPPTLPEIWQDSDQPAILEWCYDILFEEQLESWWTDEALWPKERDLKMFLDWFEVEFHSLVLDLCNEPIRLSEDEPDDLGKKTEHWKSSTFQIALALEGVLNEACS